MKSVRNTTGTSKLPSMAEDDFEFGIYKAHFRSGNVASGPHDAAEEQLRMTPLFSWPVKDLMKKRASSRPFKFGAAPAKTAFADFAQYAYMGSVVSNTILKTVSVPVGLDTPDDSQNGDAVEDLEAPMRAVSLQAAHTDVLKPSVKELFNPLFLNTNTPWSAFICGSQGSGKSHTLGCMLEGCLSNNSKIGKLPHPLAGMVFHYTKSAGAPCEAAGVHSGNVKTTVLCSPTNLAAMKSLYRAQPGASAHLTVEPLYLESSHLNIQRMERLMAFSDNEKDPPLYMQTVRKILRGMAARINAGLGEFDYDDFSKLIDDEDFDNKQKGPLRLRLDILESFMAPSPKPKKTTGPSGGSKKGQTGSVPPPPPPKATTMATKNIFVGSPGTLTVIDLTDPFLDTDTACRLFEICLSEFLDKTDCGKVVALDEAHNYMSTSAPGADIFTEKLLHTIREQRHNGARTIISTQEPTISSKLLDLCSMTFVHRFTSPAWFATIKAHIGGTSAAAIGSEGQNRMFEEIMALKLGESLLFSPTAAIRVENDEVETMKGGRVKFKTRPRISHDAGTSVLASNSRQK